MIYYCFDANISEIDDDLTQNSTLQPPIEKVTTAPVTTTTTEETTTSTTTTTTTTTTSSTTTTITTTTETTTEDLMAVIASLSDEYKNTHEAHNAKLQRLKAEEENQRRTWQDTNKNNAVLSIDLPLSAIRQVKFQIFRFFFTPYWRTKMRT